MASRSDLQMWIIEALVQKNNSASLLEVCKIVWENHENDLKQSGDLFYTWQYDIRWAATKLRELGKLEPVNKSPKGIWQIKK